jgi:hypothetical protein
LADELLAVVHPPAGALSRGRIDRSLSVRSGCVARPGLLPFGFFGCYYVACRVRSPSVVTAGLPTSPLEYPGEVAQTRQLLLVPPGNFIEWWPLERRHQEINSGLVIHHLWRIGTSTELPTWPTPSRIPPSQALLAAISLCRAPSRPAAMEDAPVRVGSIHGRGEQLPHVHGEGLEPRGTMAGYAGIWEPRGGGRHRRPRLHTRAVARSALGRLRGLYRGHLGAEEGVPVVVGLPRENPVAGDNRRAAWRHPRPAVTGRKKRCVSLPGRRTQWYSTSSIHLITMESIKICLFAQNLCCLILSFQSRVSWPARSCQLFSLLFDKFLATHY